LGTVPTRRQDLLVIGLTRIGDIALEQHGIADVLLVRLESGTGSHVGPVDA
jgi:hypothetical protein